MKPKFFTKTFTRFFFGFLCIIGLAFAVMLVASNMAAPQPPRPFDNFAAPR